MVVGPIWLWRRIGAIVAASLAAVARARVPRSARLSWPRLGSPCALAHELDTALDILRPGVDPCEWMALRTRT